MSLRVVFFDMGDTLVTVQPGWAALFVRVARAHGFALDEGAVARAYDAVFGRLDGDPATDTFDATADYDARYWREINGAVLREAGVPPGARLDDTLIALHHAFDDPTHYHLYSDAVPTLRTLRERGYRLGIISNWSWNLPELCDGLGIASFFEQIVTSARVGASKPHRAIFAHALDRMGVAASEAVHVGDSRRADVAGARAAGMRAILLDRAPAFDATDAGTPLVARSLADIPALLALATCDELT